MAGGIDYIRQSAQMQEVRDRYIKGSLTPPGPPTQHGIYASPEWTGQPYPSLGWQNIRQDQEPPEGWPRPPKFNKPGDVPGPPVQYGDPITPQTVKAGYGFIDNGIIEKNLYFYHPDHLGSSSYITDREGRITQHTEYIAFGEVLFEEHSTSRTMPYLFNGKELDTETGLYYYGARYLDSKTSLWLNTDPLSGYNPIQETEHYIDGQHNGGIYNYSNLNTYIYTYQNPIKYIDPNGKQVYFDAGALIQQRLNSTVYTLKQKVINKYNDAKQAVKNIYNTTKNSIIQTGKNTQTWIKNNRNTILKASEIMQDVGDGIAVVGYALTATGVGAKIGIPLAAIGNGVSTIGSLVELGVQLNDNDLDKAGINVGFMVLDKAAEKGINKLLPGAGNKGVNVGKEFLKQSTGLKITIIERAVNKNMEQKQDKQNNNTK